MKARTYIKAAFLGLLVVFTGQQLNAQQIYYSIASGNWNDPAIWSTEGHVSMVNNGNYPTWVDEVRISGHAITIIGDEIANSVKISGGDLVKGSLRIENNGKLNIKQDLVINEMEAGTGSELVMKDDSKLLVENEMKLQSLTNRKSAELHLYDRAKIEMLGELKAYYKGPADRVMIGMYGDSKLELSERLRLIHEGGKEKIIMELHDRSEIIARKDISFESQLPDRVYLLLNEEAKIHITGNFERAGGNGNLICSDVSEALVDYTGINPNQVLAPNKEGQGMDEFRYRHVSVTKPRCQIHLIGDVEVPGRFKMETKLIGIENRELMLKNSFTNEFDYLQGKIKNSATGNFVRQTASLEPYLFPIGNTETQNVGYSGVTMYRAQDNMQIFKMGVLDEEGLRVLHNIGLHNGEEEKITLDVATNEGLLKLYYVIGRDGKIEQDVYARFENDEPLLLTADQYSQTSRGDGLKIYSIKRIIKLLLINHRDHNWVHTRNYYPDDAVLIGEARVFSDGLGRTTQQQTKNVKENVVFTQQTIYDAYGRPALQTLPAPSGTSIQYRYGFITSAAAITVVPSVFNSEYNYTNFTGNKLNNPDPVANGTTNTLGYYYSDNGGDNMSTTPYPYSTTSYFADPRGKAKTTAAPGEQHKMGSGHEVSSYSMVTGYELRTVFGEGNWYKVFVSLPAKGANTDWLSNEPFGIEEMNEGIVPRTGMFAQKEVSVDADGKVGVVYKAGGKVVATCMSGLGTEKRQDALDEIIFEGAVSKDIHLPAATKNTLVIKVEGFGKYTTSGNSQAKTEAVTITPVGIGVNNAIDLKITDLTTNTLLIAGTDYTINHYGAIIFKGNYASGDGFFRISVQLLDKAVASIENTAPIPRVAQLKYKLDYDQWSINYYDMAGNLRKSVSPKGIGTNGEHTMVTTYDYDNLGNMIGRNSPDEGTTKYVYDDEGKMRYSQNAVQRGQKKFSYAEYDAQARIVETGEYTMPVNLIFENYHPNQMLSVNTITTYSIRNDDNMLQDNRKAERTNMLYDKTINLPAGYESYGNKLSGGKLAMSSNDNAETWYSYDAQGRLAGQVQRYKDDADHTAAGLTPVRTIDYFYNSNQQLVNYTYQPDVAAEALTHTLHYDANGKVDMVTVNNGSKGEMAMAHYERYTNGRMKRIEVGHDIQGIDYIYALNGNLKAINHPSLETNADPGMDGLAGSEHADMYPDVFGYAIDYYEGDYERAGMEFGSQGNNYGGKVSAVRWRQAASDMVGTASISKQLAMSYSYDNTNKLSNARFGVINQGSFSEWPEYAVSGNGGKINYDENGNITSLHRNGLKVSGNNYDRDKIDYIYSTTDNILQRVTDAVTTGTDDFNTGGSAADYSYNQMGQLTASVADNAGNISYYSNGLTKQITQTNGDKINYYYNERGQRIKSEFTAAGTTERDITWYVYGAGGNILAIYHYDEAAQQAGQLTEQPVYGVGGRMGVYKRAENRTLYEIKDHLGNVRATVGKDVDGNIGVDMWADYYPFGGVMPGRNGKPGDYRFGYQGQENAVDSRWSNFKLRMYSADLGRFMSIDPYGQYHSPYLAMADNPVSYIDPDGGYGYGLGFEIRRKWALFEQERAYLSSIANRRVEDYSSRHQLNGGQFYIDGMWVSERAFSQALKVSFEDGNITVVQSSSIVHTYYNAYFGDESSGLLNSKDKAEEYLQGKVTNWINDRVEEIEQSESNLLASNDIHDALTGSRNYYTGVGFRHMNYAGSGPEGDPREAKRLGLKILDEADGIGFQHDLDIWNAVGDNWTSIDPKAIQADINLIKNTELVPNMMYDRYTTENTESHYNLIVSDYTITSAKYMGIFFNGIVGVKQSARSAVDNMNDINNTPNYFNNLYGGTYNQYYSYP